MRIGIFGGSFDPIHNGHLNLAESALKECKLDKIYFVPSKSPPFKLECDLSPVSHRLKMARLGIERNSKFKLSKVEAGLPAPSYTVQTIRAFKKRFPRCEFFLILGDDNFDSFKKWKNYSEILQNCALIIGKRNRKKKFPDFKNARVYFLKSLMKCISSTEIREAIAGKIKTNLKSKCPAPVLSYIRKRRLYQSKAL